MAPVVWEEPPTYDANNTQHAWWSSIASEAKRRPGQWMRIPGDYSPSTAYNIRHGKLTAFKEGRWEVTTRKLERRRHLVWMRYLGP